MSHSPETASSNAVLPTGLSEADAAARLRHDGYNELPTAKPRTLVAIAVEVVREPMFLLLLVSGAVYLLLGDLEEALALLGAVFLVIGITLYQEQKTERALEALRDLSSPRALVIRDGVTQRIPGRDVVRDNVVVLREGDRVPADACVESCSNLFADESLLTGESVAVRKVPGVWRSPNPALGWLIAGALGVLAAILFVAPARELFRTSRPHAGDMLVIGGATAGALAWMEAVKRVPAWSRQA